MFFLDGDGVFNVVNDHYVIVTLAPIIILNLLLKTVIINKFTFCTSPVEFQIND